LCSAWNRLLIKKTKVYCIDNGNPHLPPNKDSFITEPSGISDINLDHFDLNYASGINDSKNEKIITISVKAFDLTDNNY
jgi:hypothetical protein